MIIVLNASAWDKQRAIEGSNLFIFHSFCISLHLPIHPALYNKKTENTHNNHHQHCITITPTNTVIIATSVCHCPTPFYVSDYFRNDLI